MADSSLEALRAFPRTVAGAVLNSIELPMRALQRALGVPRIDPHRYAREAGAIA